MLSSQGIHLYLNWLSIGVLHQLNLLKHIKQGPSAHKFLSNRVFRQAANSHRENVGIPPVTAEVIFGVVKVPQIEPVD